MFLSESNEWRKEHNISLLEENSKDGAIEPSVSTAKVASVSPT